MGRAMTRIITEVEGRRRLLLSTPTAISLNRLLYEVKICSTAPDTDGGRTLCTAVLAFDFNCLSGANVAY